MGGGSPTVVLVTGHFWPELTGSAPVLTQFAEYLAAHGVSVRVVTAMPFYPQWRIYPEYRGSRCRMERKGSVIVYRSWLWARPGGGTLSRILGELTLAVCAIPNMVRALRKADAAFVLTPPLTYNYVALLIAKILRVPCVMIVHDVMPDTAVELGMLRNRWAIAWTRWMARHGYSLANEVHTLGAGMRDRIVKHAEARGKVRIVPIAIDADELGPVCPERNEFRKRFVPDGTFAVLHSGNMGKKQDFGIILRAADRLQHDGSIRFYVFGDGVVRESFLEERDVMGLANVLHHPVQERWLLPHMLSGADVLLVTQLAEVVDIVVPSKLITAMAAGAMIVASCPHDSETATLLARSEAGIVVPAGDATALVDALVSIQRGEVDVKAFRERARRFAVREFGLDAVYGPIVRSLDVERSAVQPVGDGQP